MRVHRRVGSRGKVESQIALCGAHVALGPQERRQADIFIMGKRIHRVAQSSTEIPLARSSATVVDLHGFFLLPAFVNAHDHLQFALHPRLADHSYRNYIEWGQDIHAKFPAVIAKLKAVPKSVRLWWGGIRNLLCGVATVCHHDPLWPELERKDFPVRVLRNYGWAHSLALGGNLLQSRAQTPDGYPFILHACEGIGEPMRRELASIDALGILDATTVLVHGMAMEPEDVALLRHRGTSLILCPSSNAFLFGRLPQFDQFAPMENLALGNDSPLTAEGDLLDEVRFAIARLGVSAARAYEMVTSAPARILRLENGEGSISESHNADIVAVEDTGLSASARLETLSAKAIEMVMVGGKINLASKRVLERIPPAARRGLEPVEVGRVIRWVRAPVRDLVTAAEKVLGAGNLHLGSRSIRIPDSAEVHDER